MRSNVSKGLLVCALLIVGACSGGSKPPPGKPCVVNSDCTDPLSCSYGVCHVTCTEARDCTAPQICIKAPTGNVCQLPNEAKCTYRNQCMPPLACALDRQCRSQCQVDIDCPTSTQKCVQPDGVCAEPGEINHTTGLLDNSLGTPVPDAPPDAGTGDGATSDGAGNDVATGAGGTSGGSGGAGSGGAAGAVSTAGAGGGVIAGMTGTAGATAGATGTAGATAGATGAAGSTSDGGTGGASCTATQASLVNGDFEMGLAGFCSDYQLVSAPAQITTNGQCIVTADPSKVSKNIDWAAFGDRTSGHGKMLVCDGALTAGVAAWRETVPVVAGTSYVFSFWVANIEPSQSLSTFQAYVNAAPVGDVLTAAATAGAWTEYVGVWSSGTATTAALSIVDTNISGPWNDFAIDDVFFSAAICIGNATDDFSSGMLGPHWQPGVSPCATTTVSGGSLVLSRPAGCADNAGVILDATKGQVCGDFDAQVDFSLTNLPVPAAGNWVTGIAVMSVPQAGPWVTNLAIERFESSYTNTVVLQQEDYRAWALDAADQLDTFAASADVTGRFRITRVGTMLTAYYWQNGAWVMLKTGVAPSDQRLLFALYVAAYQNDNSAFTVRYDNFSLVSSP